MRRRGGGAVARAFVHASALSLLATTLACAQERPASSRAALPLKHAPRPTSAAIAIADLMTRLYAFADDSMQGREAGTIGNVRATEYLAREAARIGLTPAGDAGTWFQALPFVRRGVDSARSRLASDGAAPLRLWTDYLPVSRRGLPRPIDGARAVYGGKRTAAGVPLGAEAARGRFVIIQPRPGQPAGRLALDFPDRGGPLAGAVAVAVVVPDESLADIARWSSETELRLEEVPDTALAPSFFLVTRSAAERLLGASLAQARVGAEGRVVRGTPAFTRDPVVVRNVVALLPGTDTGAAREYVALGAHNDHVGMAPPRALDSLHGGRLDSVFNGADDDGSGSVALLEIAEAMRAGPRPKRSVLFVWHTAEEEGMIGSRWFTDHPTVPLASIVAQVNLDMIGRGAADDVPGGGPRFLQVVGARRLSTTLGDLVEAVNAERAEPFALDWSWDRPDHPERIYCRSDHYMYARRGIPVAFFMTGLHRDYHQLTDEPQSIDYPHYAAVVGYVRDLALRLANLDRRPAVDRRERTGC